MCYETDQNAKKSQAGDHRGLFSNQHRHTQELKNWGHLEENILKIVVY